MLSLIENYEQQYAVLTADFTSKIAKLSNLEKSERRPLAQELEKQLEELRELLEQMDLEVREAEPSLRAKLKTRVESYRTELNRLEAEFKLRNSGQQVPDNYTDQYELYSSVNLSEEQKQSLLDTSERLERSGNQLSSSYRVLLETEDISNQVLRDLNSQRETIQKSRSRLRETDADLTRSSRIVSSMIARSLQHRFILIGLGFLFMLVVGLSVYYSFTRR